ncbi:MAG: hypothetical protein B6U76_00140 [Desulfurococcales archaeon ex4484_217_2]|nr:MAG: hypothetical protein B6U76_00140 [Desulfurococcales archaeon ex4484_217_2]
MVNNTKSNPLEEIKQVGDTIDVAEDITLEYAEDVVNVPTSQIGVTNKVAFKSPDSSYTDMLMSLANTMGKAADSGQLTVNPLRDATAYSFNMDTGAVATQIDTPVSTVSQIFDAAGNLLSEVSKPKLTTPQVTPSGKPGQVEFMTTPAGRAKGHTAGWSDMSPATANFVNYLTKSGIKVKYGVVPEYTRNRKLDIKGLVLHQTESGYNPAMRSFLIEGRRDGNKRGPAYFTPISVDYDGTITVLNNIDQYHQHAQSFSRGTIGIEIVGKYNKKTGWEKLTEAQKRNVVVTSGYLVKAFNIKPSRIFHHAEFASKTKGEGEEAERLVKKELFNIDEPIFNRRTQGRYTLKDLFDQQARR